MPTAFDLAADRVSRRRDSVEAQHNRRAGFLALPREITIDIGCGAQARRHSTLANLTADRGRSVDIAHLGASSGSRWKTLGGLAPRSRCADASHRGGDSAGDGLLYDQTIVDALGQKTTEMARRYAKGADLAPKMRGVVTFFDAKLNKRATKTINPRC